MNNSETYLTVKDLGEMLPLKNTHIYTMIQKKQIPFVKLGGKYFFVKKEILDWVANSKVSALNNN